LWWWWQGVRFVYPEVWDAFEKALPETERGDLRANYVRRVLHPDPDIHGPAAAAWLRYEAQTLDVWPDPDFIDSMRIAPETIGAARVFAHYDAHDFFVTPGQLIDGAARLSGVPAIIVNGRFDMCTPPRAAYDLHKAWPGSKLRISPLAGHRWSDPLLARDIVDSIHELAAVRR
jgi:proline iminopeptidase